MIQYSIVLFCVLCFRPWSDTIQYCFVCCVSGCGVIQYSIVLFCVLCFRPWTDTAQYCGVLCAVFQAVE